MRTANRHHPFLQEREQGTLNGPSSSRALLDGAIHGWAAQQQSSSFRADGGCRSSHTGAGGTRFRALTTMAMDVVMLIGAFLMGNDLARRGPGAARLCTVCVRVDVVIGVALLGLMHLE